MPWLLVITWLHNLLIDYTIRVEKGLNMEQRRRERVDVDQTVLCRTYKPKKPSHIIKVPFSFEVMDLSYGGMKIRLDHLLMPHDQIGFTLSFESTRRSFECEVQWSRVESNGFVAGVQFLHLTREDVIFLFAYLKSIT